MKVVRGRGEERKGCFMSLTSYEGIGRRSNWLTENSSQFSFRLEIYAQVKSALASRFLGFIL